jgi:hypothetical protein
LRSELRYQYECYVPLARIIHKFGQEKAIVCS